MRAIKSVLWVILTVMAGPIAGCQQAKRVIHKPETSDQYIDRQLKIIDAHKADLVKAGRITDPEHFSSELYLASYSWRDGLCKEGPCSFGAYTFYQPAFEQAKKLYVIHGEILAGTDVLIDASWGECIEEKGGGCIIGSSDGYTSPRAKGAFDAAIVGYSVGPLTYCMKYGAHYEHCDEIGSNKDYTESGKAVKFIDGGHVQLDHKAKYDAQMYGLVIAPPDYVDMCDCSTPMQTMHVDPTEKPCTQNGTLQPGESCSVSVTF